MTGSVLAVVLTAAGFVIGACTGGALGFLRAETYTHRVVRMAADRRAYREWSTAAATAESVYACSYRSSIHAADCPELLTRPPVTCTTATSQQ